MHTEPASCASLARAILTGLAAVLLLSTGTRPSRAQSPPERTIIDNERGFYYAFAYKNDWAGIGAMVGLPHRAFFAQMQPEAIKLPHGHLQHFAQADPQDSFPFEKLAAYDAAETARGKPSLFVSATYQGQKRPVYFPWDLELDAARKPRAPESLWQRPVNLNDERFVRFFIHSYIRGDMWRPKYPNMWLSVDQCSFRYNLYGVLDDNSVFRDNIAWDAPYARNENAFLASVEHFVKRVKELAPDIPIIGNEGSLNDESRFPEVWADMAGSIREDICMVFAGDRGSRDHLYTAFRRYQWLGPARKVCLCRVLLTKANDYANRLRTGYVTYLLVRGPNFFFGPRLDDGSSLEVPPQDYASMQAALGLPTGPAVSQQAPDAPSAGYRLYSRPCEGGLVYLNWTSRTQHIALPAGRTFYTRDGKAITHLTIPDMAGDYALFAPGARTARTTINPRRATVVTGPLVVKLQTTDPQAAIRYTLDGSEPDAHSPIYRRPLRLTHSVRVRARAFAPGCLPGFTAVASYTLTDQPPTVQFHLAADQGSVLLDANYPLVRLDHPAGKPVRVKYIVTGGTAQGSGRDYTCSAGTLTFAPGEIYRYFPIRIVPHPDQRADKTIQITLSAPVNATLGAQRRYTYTILTQD